MLVDSDVLIWSMRGHAGAVNALSAISLLRMSVVTYMELAQGCRNKTELKQFKKALQLQPDPVVQKKLQGSTPEPSGTKP